MVPASDCAIQLDHTYVHDNTVRVWSQPLPHHGCEPLPPRCSLLQSLASLCSRRLITLRTRRPTSWWPENNVKWEITKLRFMPAHSLVYQMHILHIKTIYHVQIQWQPKHTKLLSTNHSYESVKAISKNYKEHLYVHFQYILSAYVSVFCNTNSLCVNLEDGVFQTMYVNVSYHICVMFCNSRLMVAFGKNGYFTKVKFTGPTDLL